MMGRGSITPDGRISRDNAIAKKLSDIDKKTQNEAVEKILSFNKKPDEIKKFLDEYVIGQEEGKKVLAVATAFHYKRLATTIMEEMKEKEHNINKALENARFVKKNILLIGPTGCGKTYSLEKLSHLVNVPLVTEDLTKFSATGYVGRDLEEVVLDLLAKTQNNVLLARFGIIFLDEFDKIAATHSIGKDVNGLEVQNGLLKIVEGAEFPLPKHLGEGSFSTKYNLFVAGGAFEGLKEMIKRKYNLSDDKNWAKYLTNYDLVDGGFERQLLGRFPIKVVYDELTKEDLVKIMEISKDSPITSYIKDFASWGINLKFDKDALGLIAEYSEDLGMGARGLITAIEIILLDDMYKLPGNFTGDLNVNKTYAQKKLETLR